MILSYNKTVLKTEGDYKMKTITAKSRENLVKTFRYAIEQKDSDVFNTTYNALRDSGYDISLITEILVEAGQPNGK